MKQQHHGGFRVSNPGLESVPEEHIQNTPGNLDAAEAAHQQPRSIVPVRTR
ncbi:MAG: hypothetical protein LW875_06780 [Proteobacteria bacterium]|nr:hypothetical protein [Pseudomonadota bacterium]